MAGSASHFTSRYCTPGQRPVPNRPAVAEWAIQVSGQIPAVAAGRGGAAGLRSHWLMMGAGTDRMIKTGEAISRLVMVDSSRLLRSSICVLLQ